MTFVTSDVWKPLAYGKGNALGVLSYDSVTLAGVSAEAQSFILIDSDYDFEGMQADGLFGLAFSSLSDDYPTLIESLKHQGKIPEAVFSFYLGDINNETDQSYITIGGYDLQAFDLNVTESGVNWLQVANETGFWAVTLGGMKIGSHPITTTTQLAILDTGSSMILGPVKAIADLYTEMIQQHNCGLLDNTGLLLCYCRQPFPDLVFYLEDKAFTVPPSSYFYKVSGYCLLLVTSFEADIWILGDVFLRGHYSIYDMDKSRVGLVAVSRMSDPDFDNDDNLVAVIALALVGFAVLGKLAFLVGVLLYKRHRAKQLQASCSYIAMTQVNETS